MVPSNIPRSELCLTSASHPCAIGCCVCLLHEAASSTLGADTAFCVGIASGPADTSPFCRGSPKICHNPIINKQRLYFYLNSSPKLLQDTGVKNECPKLAKCKNNEHASAFTSISITSLARTLHLKSADCWIVCFWEYKALGLPQ